MESYEHGYEDNRFENDVSKNFHCPICFNVFKDPVSCQRNQHMFCRPCITRHLKNSQTCPTCMESLTIETLNQAPRILTDYLSELSIRCDYFSRGCRDLIQLDELETHVKDCDFTPVVCSNEGCLVEVNKRDRIHHETEVCEMRKIKCHNCTEMAKVIEDIKANLTAANTKLDEIEEIKVNLTTVNDKLTELAELPKEICGIRKTQEEIIKEIRGTTQQVAKSVRPNDGSVVVAGGDNLSSVELFNWSTTLWSPLQPMNICREGASSFVFKNHITVTGGRKNIIGSTMNTMETLNTDPLAAQSPQCSAFPAKLPGNLYGHSSVLYDEQLIVMGGHDNSGRQSTYSDSVHEVMLNPPYTSKLLRRMPRPRCFHGAQLFDDKMFIVGGRKTRRFQDNLDSVIMYDIKRNECKEMTPLPFAVHEMATVRWGDNIIVIGGADNDNRALDTVVIYNVQTGRSYLLPAMKYKRRECAAAVTGNVIVVMGGKDEQRNVLKSVECFSFDRYSWEDLPSMNEARARATAVTL